MCDAVKKLVDFFEKYRPEDPQILSKLAIGVMCSEASIRNWMACRHVPSQAHCRILEETMAKYERQKEKEAARSN